MMQFLGMLAAIALTAFCWGVYGPVLHEGSGLLGSALRAFMCVGLAYFGIAIVVPSAILARGGEKGGWTRTGVIWSLIAGAAGALGALGVILALRVFHGQAVYVMPLVFGGAPVVNTLINATMNRAFGQLKAPFLAGLILVITGAATVLIFKPQTPPHSPPAQAVMADAGAEGGPAVEATAKRVERKLERKAEHVLGVLLSAAMAMLSWGAYGPVLHKGQAAMGGSRLRPLICIGVSYFLLAVLVPLVALLLTVAGWRPAALAPATAATVAAPEPPLAPVAEPIAEALVPLTVAELRRRARAAELPRALSRSGRRSDLLEALEGAAGG